MRVLVSHRAGPRDEGRAEVEGLVTGLLQGGHEAVALRAPRPLPGGAEAPFAAWRLWRAHRRVRPDLIYELYAPPRGVGSLVARRRGTPLFLELTAPPATAADHRAVRAAARVVVADDVLRDRVAAAGVDPGRIAVVPGGFDLENHPPVRRPPQPRPLAVGVFGGAPFQDGLGDLVEGVAGYPDLVLTVIGDGPDCAALARNGAALGVGARLRTIGWPDPALLPALAAEIDIAVVDGRASPAVLAAMAAGCAIVAPEPGAALLRHDRTALLLPQAATSELWAALARLAADSGLRRRLGAAARGELVVQDLTWRRRAARIVALYEGVRDGVSAEGRDPPAGAQ